MEGFHYLDHGDVRARVDELVVGVGGVGPAPGVGKGVELRLAYFAAGFANEDVVVGVGVKGRVEVNEIDAVGRGTLSCSAATEVVAEVEAIHGLHS